MKPVLSYRQVYGPAILLAGITIAGLLCALFGDGVWNALSWIMLTIPLGIIVHKLWRAKED
jgi:hypothetical protein